MCGGGDRSETFAGIARTFTSAARRKGGQRPFDRIPLERRGAVKERCASGAFPRFDSRSRGDATRTGMESPVLILQSPFGLASSPQAKSMRGGGDFREAPRSAAERAIPRRFP